LECGDGVVNDANSVRRRLAVIFAVLSCATLSLLATTVVAGPASAGGNPLGGFGLGGGNGGGYFPYPPPNHGHPPGGGAPGRVITVLTIPPTGGTASARIGAATVSAVVPSGTFSDTVQVVITRAHVFALRPPSGQIRVVTFGFGVYQHGVKLTGSFPAITVTVRSPAITAGSTVYLVTGSGLQAVSGAQVSAGSAVFSITSDPVIEVTSPAPVPPPPTYTTSTTKLPPHHGHPGYPRHPSYPRHPRHPYDRRHRG
jgi:hypothetical protein